ncbi:uncharacterized protein LTR77_003298 [Saxophila tyrrhenica]|uniref:Heterokaryon incompatibility domain-containing protein n=1 Tax=Saxophila tyrrhenica TaxID=1690608 RepID=A0AAV9PHY2_9PEZI|nr:hypothetical protein LTR77_003298 [Saxophila tyrrhenica]
MPFIKQFNKEMVLGTAPAYTHAPPLKLFPQLPLTPHAQPDVPPFHYENVGEETDIRLLRILPARDGDTNLIECEMQGFKKSDIPSYDCLSYSWGEDRASEFTIIVNGADEIADVSGDW